MPTFLLPLFFVLAFGLSMASDYLETKYVRAVGRFERGDDSAREVAARASTCMGLVGLAGLVACVEISWWLAIPELMGLYFGTKVALRRAPDEV